MVALLCRKQEDRGICVQAVGVGHFWLESEFNFLLESESDPESGIFFSGVGAGVGLSGPESELESVIFGRLRSRVESVIFGWSRSRCLNFSWSRSRVKIFFWSRSQGQNLELESESENFQTDSDGLSLSPRYPTTLGFRPLFCVNNDKVVGKQGWSETEGEEETIDQ